VFARGYGKPKPTLEPAFNLASIGKTFTGVPRRSWWALAPIAHEQLLFAPGSRWSYSNSRFVLMGLVTAKVAGEPYAAYLAEHVWRPAGMTHTGCYRRDSLPAFAAVGHLPGDGYGYGFGIPGTTVWHNGGTVGAAGELDINAKLGIVVVTLGNVGPPQVFLVVHAVLNASNVP
jgi:CubicO group peptidase (beta-lactamase class C family)